MLKVLNICKQVRYLSRRFSITSVMLEDDNQTEKKSKRKVTEPVELINLVDQNDKILGLKPKPESEKLARKLNLTLQKVDDPKFGTMYPAFKLVSITDILRTESKATTAKTLKKLPINYRISDNDLVIKLQTVRKWVAKSYEVHIAVAGNPEKASIMRAVFEKIKENLKEDGRIIDVRERDGAIKFIVLPPKKPPTSKKGNATNKESSTKE